MQGPIRCRLREDAAEGVVRGIRLDGEGQLGLKMAEDGGGGEGGLEGVKSRICLCSLGELHSLAGQGSQGGGKSRVVKNEFSIEI